MNYHADLTNFDFPNEMVDRLEQSGKSYEDAVTEVFSYYATKYSLPAEEMDRLENDPVALQGYTAGYVMDEDSLSLYGYV